MIHTSYLTPWKDGSATFPEREPPPPDPEVIDGEEHFHVEAFRAKRVRRGMLEYLVKWSGFPENEFYFSKTTPRGHERRFWMISTENKPAVWRDAYSSSA